MLTLFPGMFQGPFHESILKRAQERSLVEIHLHNIRDYALDKHRVVDDYTYGGGAGMVLKPEPIYLALEAVKQMGVAAGYSATDARVPPVILLTPQGRRFRQRTAQKLAQQPWLVLLCGHYEGVDERIREHMVTQELSIGDYVLTGGELPGMVLVDAVVRLLPGVMGSADSAEEESFSSGLLEYPQYTRPSSFRGWGVPEVLLSGDHAEVRRWRRREALLRTARRRPDLLAAAEPSPGEREWVESQPGPEI